MDVSKIERWSPSSNVYDDLRGMDTFSSSKIPSRSTSTIGYISPREIENAKIQRSAISLILPASSSGQNVTLDTVLSIDDDTKQRSSSIESNKQENKKLITNKIYNLISRENDQSCACWAVHEIIQLIYVALFASLIAMFAFTLIFYAFDIYWLEQPVANNSLWWFYNNNTDYTDYVMIDTTPMINYDDGY